MYLKTFIIKNKIIGVSFCLTLNLHMYMDDIKYQFLLDLCLHWVWTNGH